MKLFDQFTNLYSLSKTLRFELKPVGETEKFIKQDGFFDNDVKKDELYVWMKEKMDELHRGYIEKSLSTIKSLQIPDDFIDLISNKKTKGSEKELEKIYKNLRSQITNHFRGSKDLLEKDVIDKLLDKHPNEKDKINEFKGFFGYFKTYTQNRANLYKNEDKAGQIAFRLIDENLPRFIKGKQILEEILHKDNNFTVIEKNEKQEEINKGLSDYISYFDINHYHKYISQEGIDQYNAIVGHFNHSINQYKQKTGVKFGQMPLLYKLPLAPKKTISRLPQQLESIDQVKDAINDSIKRMDTRIIPFISSVFDANRGYDYHGIYINIKTSEHRGGVALTGWQSLRGLTHKASKDAGEESIKNDKFPFVSLGEIYEYLDTKQTNGEETQSVFGNKISKNDMKYSKIFMFNMQSYIQEIAGRYQVSKSNYLANADKTHIKLIMDDIIVLRRLINGFTLIHKKKHISVENKDSNFYDGDGGLDSIIQDESYSDNINVIYDKVRNFMTQKPYSNKEKIKVNFENPTLLDGRDQNKEKENYGIILKENDMYYLAVMKKGKNIFFDETKNKSLYTAGGTIQKMIYKLLPGPNKMLPKVIFSAKNIELFDPSQDILRIRETESFKQGDQFSLQDLHIWIDFLKLCLSKYDGRKHYNFSFLETNKYTKINEFYHDVERQGYEMKRKYIDKEMLNQAVEKGDMYLFQIYNKDFNHYAKGLKNIHTKYFKALFEGGDNLFKLNGEAEIFYRQGKDIENKEHRISPKHQIQIKDKRRYTQDKLMFHVPITLNFCRAENTFNKSLNTIIKQKSDDITILGIDRGEKHLLYYSLIKQDGTIIKTGSRNMIGKIDYHSKLSEREVKRDQSQANREQQEQIKDLKSGYISQVVHEISKIVIDNSAIIVLEDLNGGFKRSRQKVEKNVYQQFELALAKKLNYLIFKDTSDHEVGGIHKAYQLTPPVSQFQDLKFQTGIIFYTAPGYTSTTCPCCGRRKHLYIEYKNEKQAKDVLSQIDIKNLGSDYQIIYAHTSDKKVGYTKSWHLHTAGQIRYHYDRQIKNTHTYDIQSEFEKLLGSMDDYQNRLMNATVSQCKSLIRNLNMLMKIRNSQTGTDIDIIQCPACKFDSRQGFQGNEYNGDANGAYNIARKGKLIIDKLISTDKTMISQIECDQARVK